MWYSPYYLDAMEMFMATQAREKNTGNGTLPNSYPLRDGGEYGGEARDSPPAASDALAEGQIHLLASVIGSFRDDPASLDAIMAGVKEYRRRMEEETS